MEEYKVYEEVSNALKKKKFDTVETILNNFNDNQRMLSQAALYGNTSLLNYLLKKTDIDVNAKVYEFTILGWALEGGYIDTIQSLLKLPNIDVNQAHHHGKWAGSLYWEWEAGDDHIEVVNLLLSHPSFDPNKVTSEGDTPLTYFISMNSKKYEELIKKILKNPKTDVNLPNSDGDTPLNIAIDYEVSDDIIILLVTHPKMIINGDILVKIINYNNPNILKSILKNPKVDVNKPNSEGTIPIFQAIDNDDEISVSELLEHPMLDMNVTNEDGQTILEYAEDVGFPVEDIIDHAKRRTSRSVSEVSTMSGTASQGNSNVSSTTTSRLPQLPYSAMKNIYDFATPVKTENTTTNEEKKENYRKLMEQSREKRERQQMANEDKPSSNTGGRRTYRKRKHRKTTVRRR